MPKNAALQAMEEISI